jgi:pyruvate dehydrogenase E1 component
MIPFYIFYSMFGFQRIGDLAWAAGDQQARGFLIGATSGRTTLNGEGLQHQDGHSHLLAATIPNCVSYDPTYAYEVAVIVHHGLEVMYGRRESKFFYITTMNENYQHPEMPAGAEEGIIRGMYRLESAAPKAKTVVQLMGCGSILREVRAAAALLRADFGIDADVWSLTSINELRRDGLDAERWNLLHPTAKAPRVPYITQMLDGATGPVIASTDYTRAWADGLRPFIRQRYAVLGTDGFGRSDTRARLRHFFEVDRHFVAVAALKALADEGRVKPAKVAEAIAKYGIDPAKPNPANA